MSRIKRKFFIIYIIFVVIIALYIYFLLKESNISMACGLFAFIGTDPNYFSWDKFNILGWFNDSRGGDACGRAVGNLYQHGVDKLKTYKEFAMTIKNPGDKIIENVIIGHCRKASSGGKDDIYAQPIVVCKKDINNKMIKDPIMKTGLKSLKKDDVVFSGIHNGTIDNYDSLAPKYGIPTIDHNDSKVLLNILFYCNYKVLTQYVGTAALIFHNHILNRTFIFKGSSKSYVSSITDSEERPLFYWSVKENNFYISSIEDSLLFIGAKKEEIINFENNILYTFQDGKIIKKTKFDRKEMNQSEPTYSYKNNNSVSRNKGIYSRYDEDSFNNNNFSVIKRPLEDFIRSFLICSVYSRIQGEIFNRFYANNVIRRSVYNKTRYWMNGGLMHGVYILNSMGIVPNNTTKSYATLGLYYFIEGIMMDNRAAYNAGISLHKEFMSDLLSGTSSVCSREQKFTLSIAKYSKFPVASLTKTEGTQDCLSSLPKTNSENIYYTGAYQPLFSNRLYNFSTGDLRSIVEEMDGDKKAIHSDDNLSQCKDYYTECKKEDKNCIPSFEKGYKMIEDEDLKNNISPFQNFILWDIDLKAVNQHLQVMMVHYLRDFSEELEGKCSFCNNDKNSILKQCLTCKSLTDVYEGLTKEMNYDFE